MEDYDDGRHKKEEAERRERRKVSGVLSCLVLCLFCLACRIHLFATRIPYHLFQSLTSMNVISNILVYPGL